MKLKIHFLNLYKKFSGMRDGMLSIKTPTQKTVFISVVRNNGMYQKLVKNNPYNKGAEFVVFDNTKENITIPKRYNNFLDNYDYSQPAWFVFCHEDWETKSDWLNELKKLNKNSLYGICGTKLIHKKNGKLVRCFYGEIIGSNKNGYQKHILGAKVPTGMIVDTFDCMCLIIHSSLIKKYCIRFDENLTWHLYAEEMCIRLKEKFNIPSRILQIKSRHWSNAAPNDEYYKLFDDLIKKFGKTKHIYTFTCHNRTIMPIEKKFEGIVIPKKITTNITLFDIPVWKKDKYLNY